MKVAPIDQLSIPLFQFKTALLLTEILIKTQIGVNKPYTYHTEQVLIMSLCIDHWVVTVAYGMK